VALDRGDTSRREKPMKKKYKLKLEKESGLYRIIALRDFRDVKAGDIGGLISDEKNLSQEGNAWVHGNARVFGDAQVFGNAWVFGNARVFGDAWVFGDARVHGNARVYGDAQVFWDAQVYGNARVFGDAQVFGNAWVYGNARVFGNAQVSGDARVFGNAWETSPLQIQTKEFFANMATKTIFKIGCEEHTFPEWTKNLKSICAEHERSKDYGYYLQIIKFARSVHKTRGYSTN